MTREEAIEIANAVELCQTIWIDEPDCEAIDSIVRFAQRVQDMMMPPTVDAEWLARRTRYDVERERMKAYPLFEALEKINMLSVSQFRNHADMALECQDIAGCALDKHVRERVAQPEQEPLAYTVSVKCHRCGSSEIYDLTIDALPPQRKPLTDEQQVLRSLMERENNWANQGGACGYDGDGKWNFVSRSIDVTPEELNALFKLAGVEPKKIVSKGSCANCAHAINGRERGYERPCSTCCRPIMSNFEAAHGIKGDA